jgi:hypothetical protein
MYGGGPLNKEVGDYLAAQGVAVLANYGRQVTSVFLLIYTCPLSLLTL